jgi:hypothetical protein
MLKARLFAPFVCRSAVEAVLAVRRSQRYIANGRIKYLLKDLLKQRLPAFNVDEQKAGGDLPFPRYLTSGPLKNAFDRNAMPEIVDREIAAATRAAPDWLTWNLLTLAIWRDEVLADAALARYLELVLMPSARGVATGSLFMANPEDLKHRDPVAAPAKTTHKSSWRILQQQSSERSRLAVGHGLDREGEVSLRKAMGSP